MLGDVVLKTNDRKSDSRRKSPGDLIKFQEHAPPEASTYRVDTVKYVGNLD
jgi:hypothetical protein